MSLGGLVVSVLGVLYAMIVVVNALFGVPAHGWTSLMVVVLFLGGGQMFMLGVLGEYIWRGLKESRRRPRYLIDRTRGAAPPAKPAPAARKPLSTSSQRITALAAARRAHPAALRGR